MHRAAMALVLLAWWQPVFGQTGELSGAWRPQVYVMKDGTERVVDGAIFFTGSDWATIFFIQNGPTIERGAAEGGVYTLSGTRLLLKHRYHLSAGAPLPNVPEQAPLRMELKKPGEEGDEPCEVELAGDRLTLRFPSGNLMRFVRTSR